MQKIITVFFFDNGGRPTPRVGPRSTLKAFVDTLCAHRPLLGSSLFPTTFNIDLFIDTNCQTSLLPGPSLTPQSRHLRSPGAQLHHSIITTAFRSAASVGRLGNLTPKIKMARAWRTQTFGPAQTLTKPPSPTASSFLPSLQYPPVKPSPAVPWDLNPRTRTRTRTRTNTIPYGIEASAAG